MSALDSGLVLCTCGHALDRHDARTGCRGETTLRCACARSAEAALEAAIDRARSDPWGFFTPGEPVRQPWRRDQPG